MTLSEIVSMIAFYLMGIKPAESKSFDDGVPGTRERRPAKAALQSSKIAS
jgi:hypothetical protein